jgi:hypothetical protein
MTDNWLPVKDQPPADGRCVETRLFDQNGERNVQVLKRQGRLWPVADGSTYVYYAPTHWRPMHDS